MIIHISGYTLHIVLQFLDVKMLHNFCKITLRDDEKLLLFVLYTCTQLSYTKKYFANFFCNFCALWSFLQVPSHQVLNM
jgi:hypothetical protein